MPTSPPTDHDLDFGPTLRGLRAGMKVFAQRYTLVRTLGRGGMGVVWLAHDSRLDREVALKFLPESVQGDPVAVDELKRETKRCLQLTHPNIVRIFDFEQEEHSAAIAMEYIEGRTLSELRLERPSRVFETDEILPWLQTAVAALQYAHAEARMVHRDLKPANFMLDRDGRLKLADFGIACRIGDSFSRLSRGVNSAGAGTLVYMSPQQMMGFPPSVADDIYSLGATLYELLTSRPPFHSGSIERQIEAVVPPSMTARRAELEVASTTPIPATWEQAVAACLNKEIQSRPPSVEDVLQLILGVPAVVEDAPPAPSRNVVQARGGSPNWLVVAAVFFCVGLAWASYYFGYAVPHERAIQRQVEADKIAAQTAAEATAARLQGEKDAAERLLREKDAELKREQMAEKDARDKQMALQAELDRKKREDDEAQRQKMAMEEQRRREDASKPKVLKVPGDYATISSAMDAARPKDSILVSPGIYEECVSLKSGVELRGVERDSTIIRNSSELTNLPLFCFNCDSGSVSNLTIEQKIRQSGDAGYSAVSIKDSSITLDNCHITCLSAHGVSISGSGSPIVASCRVENCRWNGIFVYANTGQPELRNNTCSNNSQSGIIFSEKAKGTIFANTCSDNKQSGIRFTDGSSGLIKANICDRNSYNGIDIQGQSTKPEVVGNRANGNGWFGIIVEAACVPRSFENNSGSGNSKGEILRTGVVK